MNRFQPAASIDQLQARAELLTRFRSFFQSRGFWEVETPLICSQTVVDRYLDPIAVDWPSGQSDNGRVGWLQTSPELCMKRLLAAGAQAIFQISRAFRRDEVGPHHNPEFTMAEWYRVGDDLEAGMDLVADLCDEMLPSGRPLRMTYEHAFESTLAINPHTARIDQLRNAANRQSLSVPKTLTEDRDDWLNLLLAECIQPKLGQDRPMLLYDYPASQAALAKVRDEQPPVAERFELFVRGIEIANGYHELLDAQELARRQQMANVQRVRDGKPKLPTPELLIEAMKSGLPPCTGVALGFDRLTMLATGAESIDAVVAFPFDRI